MKRIVILCIFFVCVAFTAAAQFSRGGTLYASTKSLALKASTGFFARTNGNLVYGDQVTVLQVSGKWVEVRSAANASLSGWTASANLTARRITSGNTITATASEIGLAGKGFNEEIENAYKSEGQLNYADVDKTETAGVTEDNLHQFLIDGRLSTGE